MPKKRVQCPLQTLTYMFAWPSMSGKWAQTIFPPFVPFLGILIASIYRESLHYPWFSRGCWLSSDKSGVHIWWMTTKTETSQICLISSAYLAMSSFYSFPFVFSQKIWQSASSSRVCPSMYLRERNWKQLS